MSSTTKSSTVGFKYPTLRDSPLRSAANWLKGKRCDDGAEGLWRIHDGLYDFDKFVNEHPGGPSWLKLTKGTDITEAFETHHIRSTPETMLPKFYIRNAVTPRNSPFTFEKNGFYKTLKKEVAEILKTAPTWPVQRSKIIIDLLLLNYVTFSFFAIYLKSYALGTIAGFCLASMATAAHNFFHRKDNFRMYYFDLAFFSSRSWRISHVLSHHMYTNTITDYEIFCFEPMLEYLPNKSQLTAFICFLLSPLIYTLTAFSNCVMETLEYMLSGEASPMMFLLPFSIPLSIIIISGTPFSSGFIMFAWIVIFGSFQFGFIGLIAGHHHPEIFHDGDAARPIEELDWGVHQLDAVMERNDIRGSHYLVLTAFGDHSLHHLFPTVDHGLLNYLYPVLEKTSCKFGVQFRKKSAMVLLLGQFKQILKTLPNPIAPPPLKRTKI